jgi:hypothetical protein
MMPRLEAGEALSGYRLAVLSGGMQLERDVDRQTALGELQRKVTGAPPPAPVKADPADLAGMGIGIQSANGDLPTINDLESWLGQPPSDSGERDLG